MTEVAKWHANLSRLSIRGNYRAVAAQDMAKDYSRNSPQRKISASKFAQKAFQGNKDAESIADDPSSFLEECPLDNTPSGEEFQGLKPAGWALAI